MRRLVIPWAALLVLLAATAGLELLPLGWVGMPLALVIAFAMAMVIAVVCMRIGTAPRLAAIFAIGGLCWFLVLLTLGSVDYRSRTTYPIEGAIYPAIGVIKPGL